MVLFKGIHIHGVLTNHHSYKTLLNAGVYFYVGYVKIFFVFNNDMNPNLAYDPIFVKTNFEESVYRM